ncbi:hypothetical protein CSOJ01_03609 [Colletotrichum sojae]|uniref:Uncharacterized protein n=1 Tax=Colletotrichum sojae TaxID=2175907 RepID=A0A8H6JMB8_9PEZI|nr:hypothetical protein CSOJ01_03609 [Colletotrichum sojae]
MEDDLGPGPSPRYLASQISSCEYRQALSVFVLAVQSAALSGAAEPRLANFFFPTQRQKKEGAREVLQFLLYLAAPKFLRATLRGQTPRIQDISREAEVENTNDQQSRPRRTTNTASLCVRLDPDAPHHVSAASPRRLWGLLALLHCVALRVAPLAALAWPGLLLHCASILALHRQPQAKPDHSDWPCDSFPKPRYCGLALALSGSLPRQRPNPQHRSAPPHRIAPHSVSASRHPSNLAEVDDGTRFLRLFNRPRTLHHALVDCSITLPSSPWIVAQRLPPSPPSPPS